MNDSISRQAAISLPVKPRENRYFQTQNLDDAYDYGWYSLQRCIEKLPAAQPERKTGKWTDDNACPFCGFQPWYERDIHTLSFCPNCGADMRGEKNETD